MVSTRNTAKKTATAAGKRPRSSSQKLHYDPASRIIQLRLPRHYLQALEPDKPPDQPELHDISNDNWSEDPTFPVPKNDDSGEEDVEVLHPQLPETTSSYAYRPTIGWYRITEVSSGFGRNRRMMFKQEDLVPAAEVPPEYAAETIDLMWAQMDPAQQAQSNNNKSLFLARALLE